MSKIIIVIGQSASGKSTFVKNNFMGLKQELFEEPFKYTISNNICFLGDYLADKRCVGTDTLSYNIIDKLCDFVRQNYDKYTYIVAEGDRINNKKFFEAVKELNVPADLYVLSCSLKESMERLKANKSTITETFVKTTKTKASNMRLEGKRLGFNVIDINTGTEEKNLLNF